ncbi:putative exopolysaccharide inner membrane protein [Rosellinia necatrix]|uniref:Putative exopolysaccharide inner membrane protein n=1 Tax=Rosellinia necatrix TaxID=77044 RepID=A0A1W2TJY9_ROSNE|nr:putative exopolysaccharide inner membrane protein [Rosellinia necatrix]
MLRLLAVFQTILQVCAGLPFHDASPLLPGHFPRPFAHPGALHSAQDLIRVRQHVENHDEPWYTAFQHLETSTLAQLSWVAKPHDLLIRGTNATYTTPNTYTDAYRDAHSAYQLTLRWLFTNNTSYADHAVSIIDSWSSALTDIAGTEDMYLAAGLYGYQFANVGELLRVYSGWAAENRTAFANMLTNIFAPYSHDFLEHHNNKQDFYYANWDLCNIASLMAIGIFTDNHTMYDYAVNYFRNGLPNNVVANGALPFFSIANFTEEGSGKTLMEIQESGRDQGHALLCMALLGVIGQQGYNQGVDLYGQFGHQILNAAEYVAKYNTGHDVPYTAYESWEGNLTVISAKSRYDVRPGYEALVSHYADRRGMNASWSEAFRDYVNANKTLGVEGGGGDYGPNSGGFDTFGHGTLMYRLKGV